MENINLEISNRTKTNYISKVPYGIGATAAKSLAFKDISEHNDFTKNYILIEKAVLQQHIFAYKIIRF